LIKATSRLISRSCVEKDRRGEKGEEEKKRQRQGENRERRENAAGFTSFTNDTGWLSGLAWLDQHVRHVRYGIHYEIAGCRPRSHAMKISIFMGPTRGERGLRVLVTLPFRERDRGRSRAKREAAASKPPSIPL